jgi:hypothetical protein
MQLAANKMQARVSSAAKQQAPMAPCMARTVSHRASVNAIERLATVASPAAVEVRRTQDVATCSRDHALTKQISLHNIVFSSCGCIMASCVAFELEGLRFGTAHASLAHCSKSYI